MRVRLRVRVRVGVARLQRVEQRRGGIQPTREVVVAVYHLVRGKG